MVEHTWAFPSVSVQPKTVQSQLNLKLGIRVLLLFRVPLACPVYKSQGPRD